MQDTSSRPSAFSRSVPTGIASTLPAGFDATRSGSPTKMSGETAEGLRAELPDALSTSKSNLETFATVVTGARDGLAALAEPILFAAGSTATVAATVVPPLMTAAGYGSPWSATRLMFPAVSALSAWAGIKMSAGPAPAKEAPPASVSEEMLTSLRAETADRAHKLSGPKRARQALLGLASACLIGAFVVLPLSAGAAGAALPVAFLGLAAASLISFVFASRLKSAIAERTVDYEVARKVLDAAEQSAAESMLTALHIAPEAPAPTSSGPRGPGQPARPSKSYQVAWEHQLALPNPNSQKLLIDLTRRVQTRRPEAHRPAALVGATMGSRLGLSRTGEHAMTAAAVLGLVNMQYLQIFLAGCIAVWLGLHRKLLKE